MFPYYWNSSIFSPQYEAGILLGRKNEKLPEEVREALEEHSRRIRTAGDRERFLNELELRK